MKKVIIIGGGFGGLKAAQQLASKNVSVTLIDKKNHHTFQPLLYQVATATLSAADIAQPIRGILRNQQNLSTVLEEVTGIDVAAKTVCLADNETLAYDYLIVATGATHSYFANPEWEQFAPGLKTIEDALQIRRKMLLALEEAEQEQRKSGKNVPINFVVIGGGPTGVELAGAFADTCRRAICHDYRSIDTSKARIILIEALPKVLGPYPEHLSSLAAAQLEDCGVEIMTNTQVTDVRQNLVVTSNGEIPAALIVWAAGVKASSLGSMLSNKLDRRGCVLVNDYLNPPDHPEVFVCGDLAHFEQDGKQIPGVAQTAMQMGVFAGRTICGDLENLPRKPFRYFDKGDMATIGRMHAVANIKWPFRAQLGGFVAWCSWLVIHIFFLVGLRNRMLVFTQWVWTFFSNEHSALLITDMEKLSVAELRTQSTAKATIKSMGKSTTESTT
jgi:NADH dehydrogenase